MKQKLSIVIPAFNEENSILKVLRRVTAVQLINQIEKEIIVVDDCSTDRTFEIVEQFIIDNTEVSIILNKHVKNQGKGSAIRTGIHIATGDFLVIQDADLEYNPAEFNLLLNPILEGFADVVYGSRFIGGKPHRVLFFWHSIGNKILTFISNMFTNLNLTDMETCYKLFKMEQIKSIKLKENRFGFEPEVTCKIARIENIRIYEVGISYFGRTYKEGKKINWKDALRAIYCILKYGLFDK